VLYYQIAEFLPIIGEIVGAATLGIASCSAPGSRSFAQVEADVRVTADRAGLLACQDAGLASPMMKLAGLPPQY